MMEARVCDYSVKNGGTFASRYKTNYNLKKEDGKNIDNRCLRIPTSSKSDWTMNVVCLALLIAGKALARCSYLQKYLLQQIKYVGDLSQLSLSKTSVSVGQI